MPNGQMTGSPAAINFSNMDPQLYNQMNGGPRMQPPPSSNPAFPAQLTPQQIEAMQRAQAGARMPNGNGNWPQGPQGQAPMMQPGQPQQPPPMGTPQQRNNEMPPPQGVPAAAAANGRPGSPPAPPTPQQSNKANPKGKKDSKAKVRHYPPSVPRHSQILILTSILEANQEEFDSQRGCHSGGRR